MRTYRSKLPQIKTAANKFLSRGAVLVSMLALVVPALVPATAIAAGTSTQFTDPNPQSGDEFGYALSISQDGNIAVVGSPDSTVNGQQLQGTAYIFVNNSGTWTEVAQLAPSDNGQYDRFGGAVSITPDGSKVVVGAFYAPPNTVTTTQSGNAFVYNAPATDSSNNPVWNSANPVTESVKLAPSDATPGNNDNFGNSVAFSADGSTVVVGAKFHGSSDTTSPSHFQGEGYVFSQPAGGWTGATLNESAILNASDGGAFDNFGWSVATSADGSEILVGSPGGGAANSLPGSVYVYNKTGSQFTESSKLMPPAGSNPAAGDVFGSSVAVTTDGQTAIIGAPNHTTDSNTSGNGAAYSYSSNSGTWSQGTELPVPTDHGTFDEAGYSVAIASDGTSLLIGAPAHTVNGLVNEGTAYQYNTDGVGGWVLNSELKPISDGANQDFGWSSFIVSNMAEGNAFVGAPALTGSSGSTVAPSALRNVATHPMNNSGVNPNGAAYAFDLAPTISSFTPTAAPAGSTVTITGTKLSSATGVSFNGTAATILSDSATQITTTVPAGATSGPITVTTLNGQAISATSFTVIPPTIKSFTPATQGEGGKVTIKGTNLQNTTQVTINGQALQIVKNTPTSIIALLPLNALTGYLVVSTPTGTVQSSTQLTVAGPVVTTITATAKVGAPMVIHGSFLAGVQHVQFNGGAPVTPLSATSSAVKVIVPAGATSGPVTVTAPSGQATSSTSFVVKP